MTEEQFDQGRAWLDDKVYYLWVSHGFRFRRVILSQAPSSLDELRAAYATGQRLPVFGGCIDRTIYSSPEDNLRFRAWHDAVHLCLGAPFTPEGEEAVARQQVRQLAEWANYTGCVTGAEHAAAILYADVMAQVEYFEEYQAFPDNQLSFIRTYLIEGEDVALDRRW